MDNMSKGYSQNYEEKHITEYFAGRTGKYIDIGAFHYEKLSNTRRLHLNGWQGILVEADPINYKAIADHYAGDERVTVLGFAVGETTGHLTWYSSGGDAISTSDPAHRDKWAKGGINFTETTVEQLSIVSFMETYCKDVNFISMDVEGTNYQLFQLIPDWVFEQIDAFCIEHDNKMNEIILRLNSFGFRVLYTNAENIIMTK